MTDFAENNTQTMDFGIFTIRTPISWRRVDRKNSENGKIALDDTDIIEFNFGANSQDISLYQKLEIEDVQITMLEEDDEDRTEKLIEDLRTSEFVESSLHSKVIDGIEAKILMPKVPGKGAVGISFESLSTINVEINKFNLFGINLKPVNEKAFINALKTLKFQRAR